MESRHEEGQTDKQRLYQRKRSNVVLKTYTRYMLGWAATEEFLGGGGPMILFTSVQDESCIKIIQSSGSYVSCKRSGNC